MGAFALRSDELDALFKWPSAASEPHSSLPRVLRPVKNVGPIFGRVNERGQSGGVC